MRNKEAAWSLPAPHPHPKEWTVCGEEDSSVTQSPSYKWTFDLWKRKVFTEEAFRCEDKFTQSNTDSSTLWHIAMMLEDIKKGQLEGLFWQMWGTRHGSKMHLRCSLTCIFLESLYLNSGEQLAFIDRCGGHTLRWPPSKLCPLGVGRTCTSTSNQ